VRELSTNNNNGGIFTDMNRKHNTKKMDFNDYLRIVLSIPLLFVMGICSNEECDRLGW